MAHRSVKLILIETFLLGERSAKENTLKADMSIPNFLKTVQDKRNPGRN